MTDKQICANCVRWGGVWDEIWSWLVAHAYPNRSFRRHHERVCRGLHRVTRANMKACQWYVNVGQMAEWKKARRLAKKKIGRPRMTQINTN